LAAVREQVRAMDFDNLTAEQSKVVLRWLVRQELRRMGR